MPPDRAGRSGPRLHAGVGRRVADQRPALPSGHRPGQRSPEPNGSARTTGRGGGRRRGGSRTPFRSARSVRTPAPDWSDRRTSDTPMPSKLGPALASPCRIGIVSRAHFSPDISGPTPSRGPEARGGGSAPIRDLAPRPTRPSGLRMDASVSPKHVREPEEGIITEDGRVPSSGALRRSNPFPIRSRRSIRRFLDRTARLVRPKERAAPRIGEVSMWLRGLAGRLSCDGSQGVLRMSPERRRENGAGHECDATGCNPFEFFEEAHPAPKPLMGTLAT